MVEVMAKNDLLDLAEPLRRGERCTPREQAAAKPALAHRKARRAAAKRAIKSGRMPIER